MTFKEKKTMLDLITEFHWVKNEKGVSLYVFINLWEFNEFSKFFLKMHLSLFNEEGIKCHWKGSYVCIPNFDDVLDFIGLSEEEMHEMFEEE